VANRPSDIPVTTSPPGPNTEVFVSRVDPNHHLWRNGRLWWIAFTVHRGHLQERVRFSLRTDDLSEARRRRDEVLTLYASAADCRISIRLRPRAPARGGHRRRRNP
jgi:hypothetical protein